MRIYEKYIVTCEKKDKSFFDKITNKQEQFEIRSEWIINGFRDKINTEIYRILSIQASWEKMEVFWC